MGSPGCPTSEDLLSLVQGGLPESVEAVLTGHISECGDCQTELNRLSAVSQFQSLVRTNHCLEQPACLREAMEELKATTPLLTPGPTDSVFASGELLHGFGDYQILSELGRGGMGVVYRARQISLNRQVALKLILAGQLASAGDVRRFRNEAEASARLEHPNIVPIYEVGEREGRHYFSMKFIEGHTLSQRLAATSGADVLGVPAPGAAEVSAAGPGPHPPAAGDREQGIPPRLGWRSSVVLLATISRAVHYAHLRGVLHRDIKPANILLDAQGQPHLTDFGLAKLLENQSGLTHSGVIMGTPSYMAPEVANGDTEKVTTAADIYSLGAVLYELLTGRPPFVGDTVAGVLHRLVTFEPTPPSVHEPSLPPDLDTIALKCLEKDPVRRYHTAEELAEELDRFTRGEPILARPTTFWERGWKWAKRQPALAAALTASVVLFFAGFAGVLWKWQGEITQRQRAEAASQRIQQMIFRLETEHAESFQESGDVPKGFALLARQLRNMPTNRLVAERLLSGLSYRSFCFPLAPLHHDSPLPLGGLAAQPEVHNSFFSLVSGSLLMARFSEDGERVLTTGKDGTVRVWRASTGEAVLAPLRHAAAVCHAEFSRDGRRLVSASLDGTAQVWDAETGQPIGPPFRHRGPVWHAAFSPDGDSVVTASQDRTVRIWPVKPSAVEERIFELGSPVCFASFSPDGRWVFTAERQGPVRVWDRLSGESFPDTAHRYLRESPRPFPACSFDGANLLTFYGRAVQVSDLNAVGQLKAVLAHDDLVLTVAWSPDGSGFATGARDGGVRMWDGRSMVPRTGDYHHDHAVLSLDFAPDGQLLLTGSSDRTARLWSVPTGQARTEPLRHDSAVIGANLAKGVRRLVTVAESGPAWLWMVPPSSGLALTLQHTSQVSQARFSPDGQRIWTLTGKQVFVWEAGTGRLLGPAISHPNIPQDILDVDISPTDGRLATASEHGNVLLRDPFTGRVTEPRLRNYPAGEPPIQGRDAVHAVRFGPDGERLVTAGESAKLWEVSTGKRIRELRHSDRVNWVQFGPDGTRIITASADGTARLWDGQTGLAAAPPLTHQEEVFWAAFDRTGERVVTASRDKTAEIWAVRNGRKLLTEPLRHAEPLGERYSVEFSPDGLLVVTAAGNVVQIWHADSGRAAAPSLHHPALVLSVRFSPRGHRLVTACADGVAYLWDPATGQLASEPLRHGRRVNYAEFSPTGRDVLTCSVDGTARIWPVVESPVPVPAWLPELAEALVGERLDEEGVSRPVPVASLAGLYRQALVRTDSTYYTLWARWFMTGEERGHHWETNR